MNKRTVATWRHNASFATYWAASAKSHALWGPLA